ncbi:MAG: M1 family metallopeptidase [bacterium]|nr:M1 family metallopeptidase [bacterium]MCP5066643.1 M1 family metallopeptidase [bacterium]
MKLAPAPILVIAICALLVHAPRVAGGVVPVEDDCSELADGPLPGEEGKGSRICGQQPEERSSLPAQAPDLARLEAEGDSDVSHYLLEIEIIPEYSGQTVTAVRVEGVSTIDFEPTVAGLTTFTVDLHAPLTVNAVTGDVGSWARAGDTVEITLDRAYGVGEPVQVSVDYEGYPQDTGFGAFRWWMRNGELVVATLSEPFYARYWWPCKDTLDDKATMQMHVTVPTEMVALSNGLDQGSQPLGGGRTRYFWQETHPMIPYLASLAITGYERYDLQYTYDDGGIPASMPVPCYVYPDHWDYGADQPNAAQKSGCDELPGMLGTLSQLYGQYPWIDEKYGVVETGGSGGLGASMEHQTLSSMWRLDSYSDIMAHELAHQWWGDEVTCQTWYDIWLNEAFATYGEALYREFKVGGSRSLYWNRMNDRRPSTPDRQVYRTSVATSGDIFSMNDIYQKGSWVVHMLRHVLGDTAFFAALTDYRAGFADDSATTAEFVASISASFGEDLTWFTDQWIMNPGSPDYQWNYAVQTLGSQTYLKLGVWQDQSTEGYGLITMPIDIRVTTASGSTSHRIWNDDWTEYYVLPVDGVPSAVEFDAEEGISDHNDVLWDSRSQVGTALAPPPALLVADVALPTMPGAPTSVLLRFSEDIASFDATDMQLTGTSTGTHAPDSWSYDSVAREASATWEALPPDSYLLEVLDAAIFANGKALDGETDSDAWWDDVTLPSGDGQPGGDAGILFDIDWPECNDGADNDGDGWTDFPDDPGCLDADWPIEDPQCQDGLNNDPGQDGLIDFDGGLSVLGYVASDPDPQCLGFAWRNREGNSATCGLGIELAPLLAGLCWLRRRRQVDHATEFSG